MSTEYSPVLLWILKRVTLRCDLTIFGLLRAHKVTHSLSCCLLSSINELCDSAQTQQGDRALHPRPPVVHKNTPLLYIAMIYTDLCPSSTRKGHLLQRFHESSFLAVKTEFKKVSILITVSMKPMFPPPNSSSRTTFILKWMVTEMWPTANSLSPDNDGLWPQRKGKLTFSHNSGCCFMRAFPWQPQTDHHKRVVGNRGIDLHPEHKEYSRTAFYRMAYTEMLRRSELLTSGFRLMLILRHFSARRCVWMVAFHLLITSN